MIRIMRGGGGKWINRGWWWQPFFSLSNYGKWFYFNPFRAIVTIKWWIRYVIMGK